MFWCKPDPAKVHGAYHWLHMSFDELVAWTNFSYFHKFRSPLRIDPFIENLKNLFYFWSHLKRLTSRLEIEWLLTWLFVKTLMNLASVESLQGHRFRSAGHRLPASCPDVISEFKHCDFTEWHKIKQTQGSMSVWFKDWTSKTTNILVIEPVTMSVCRCKLYEQVWVFFAWSF